jgi:dATP pyrophosphohydrolase
VHDRGRVLLFHRRPERGNFWQPITGAIEDGETPLAAARRELLEESGQIVEPEAMDLQQSFMIESQYLSSRLGNPVLASEIAFLARVDSRAAIRVDPDEHDGCSWFTFGEAYERIRWTDDREALEQLERRLAASGDLIPELR